MSVVVAAHDRPQAKYGSTKTHSIASAEKMFLLISFPVAVKRGPSAAVGDKRSSLSHDFQ